QGGGPASARASAPVDFTGMWVSIVTEDWRWRMRTPPKGDYASLPLTDAAVKVADSWDPVRDAAAGEQCRPFGGAAIMRVPGRIRIAWSDDTTLKVETEAGTQTREFAFGAVQAVEPSWQGVSRAPGPGRGVESRDDEPATRVPAQEWCSLQCECARHGVFQSRERSQRRFMAHRDDDGGAPAILECAVRDQFPFQEGARRRHLEADGMRVVLLGLGLATAMPALAAAQGANDV